MIFRIVQDIVFTHLMTVANSRYNLTEKRTRLVVGDSPLLREEIVKFPTSSIFHHNHDFVLVFENYKIKSMIDMFEIGLNFLKSDVGTQGLFQE